MKIARTHCNSAFERFFGEINHINTSCQTAEICDGNLNIDIA